MLDDHLDTIRHLLITALFLLALNLFISYDATFMHESVHQQIFKHAGFNSKIFVTLQGFEYSGHTLATTNYTAVTQSQMETMNYLNDENEIFTYNLDPFIRLGTLFLAILLFGFMELKTAIEKKNGY